MKIIKEFFYRPKKSFLYAVNQGDYIGEFFIYFKSLNDNYLFLSLPDMFIRTVPKNSFIAGLKNDILTPYKKLPTAINKVCRQQFLKNIKNPSYFTNNIKARSLKNALNTLDSYDKANK